jgi:hypothetical protein
MTLEKVPIRKIIQSKKNWGMPQGHTDCRATSSKPNIVNKKVSE